MRRKSIIVLLVCCAAGFAWCTTAFASRISEALCEMGVKFYHEGRYAEAQHEFEKALMVEPDYAPAKHYLEMIRQATSGPEEQPVAHVSKQETLPEVQLPIPVEQPLPETPLLPVSPPQKANVDETLEMVELENEMISTRHAAAMTSAQAPYSEGAQTPAQQQTPAEQLPEAPGLPAVITLDNRLNDLPHPIEIEQGKRIIVQGSNISKFLVTEPNVVSVERDGSDRLVVSGKEIGYTYIHIWDDNGRWTTEWLGVFPQPVGPTYEERMRSETLRARAFKLYYSFDWNSFYDGRGLGDWQRRSNQFAHGLGLTGETPYGDLDSWLSVRSDARTTDLTYFTMGLTNGQWGPFKGFTLRGADFYPPINNLLFSGLTLRGGMLSSPAFDNKLQYLTFWGQESGGRYGDLSPGLSKNKKSFLDGLNVNYSPEKHQTYALTVMGGYGRDRFSYLSDTGVDLAAAWDLSPWQHKYEIATDMDHIAQVFDTKYWKDTLHFNAQLRDISKKYYSMIGTGWRQGELGTLYNAHYEPTDRLSVDASLDVYRDRLLPAQDNPDRWNQDLSWNTAYRITDNTSLNASYTFLNDLGHLFESRYQQGSIGGSSRLSLFRDLYLYLTLSHQENTGYNEHSNDYINERIYGGLRYNLIGQFYYYLNLELNFMQEEFYGTWAHPKAFETGVDWQDRVGTTPFYGYLRFSFHKEKDTNNRILLYAGQSYIDGYAELTYRPTETTELYGSAQVRNIWAVNPTVDKRIEGTFNGGLRYVWDTGFHWEGVGDIDGYVFRDLNSDGLRQRDEAPIEGVRIYAGKDKTQETDVFGYYCFKHVKAKEVQVSIDTTTIPSGYILTVPAVHSVMIMPRRTQHINFGILSHSEIRGIVFEDVDGDGKFTSVDKGIRGVALTLDNKTVTKTEPDGSYSFLNVATGNHTVSLDLNSLPVYYLPEQALLRSMDVFEGMTFVYNIPIKRAPQ